MSVADLSMLNTMRRWGAECARTRRRRQERAANDFGPRPQLGDAARRLVKSRGSRHHQALNRLTASASQLAPGRELS